MAKRKHIDDVQPATVDEHFKLLLEDQTVIESEYHKVTKDDLPEWFDEKLFKAGQSFYLRNILSIVVGHVLGLLAIMSVPEIAEILKFTKQSSTTCLAFKRYAQTLLYTYKMVYSDINDSDSLWYKSLNTIRWKHVMANRMCQKHGMTGIRQKEMAITQFGFVGFPLLSPEELGTTNEPEGRMAFNHYWRVTGHMLGIPDWLNICRKTEAETTELCKRVRNEIIKVHLEAPTSDYTELVNPTLNGVWYFDITTDPEAILAVTYQVSGAEYKKPLSLYTRFNIMYHTALVHFIRLPYIGWLVRICLNYIYMASYWVLEYCPVIAWLSFGKEKSRLYLFPKIK